MRKWRIRMAQEILWEGLLTDGQLGKLINTFVCVVDSGVAEIALVRG